jgi:hypothetical protein
MLGLCLVAVLAVAAIAATTASAGLPEWGKCVAKPGTGKYEDSNCTVKAHGTAGKQYEWEKGSKRPNVPFEGTNVGTGGVLSADYAHCYLEGQGDVVGYSRARCEAAGGTVYEGYEDKVECEGERNTGETHGANQIVNVTVKFTGCKLFGSVPCSNGENEGEINVNPLKGELGYINKAEKAVGVLLEPATKKSDFVTFNCSGILVITVGQGNTKEGAWYSPENHGGYNGIISPITPVNQMTIHYEQVYTGNAESQNIPSHFEGKHNEVLESYFHIEEKPKEGSMWSPADEEITNVNTSSEEGEIKA